MNKIHYKQSNIYFENSKFTQLNKFLLKGNYSNYFILVDSNTLANCYPILLQNCPLLKNSELIEIEAGEENKNIETCILVWQTLTELNADKNSLIINLGGGLISDLGGFVASVYKRGVSFINIPTTLLAMVDASVGGKCGVDFLTIKNHLGTITQANGIFIESLFLNTLSSRQLKNGMAEIIKIGLIADSKLITDLQLKKKAFIDIIKTAIALKLKVVTKDPNEKGLRKILNFGHTLGHAIESTYLGTKKELLHGEAVAIGMLIETIIAYNLKLITKKDLSIVSALIKPNYQLLKFNKKETELILKFIAHDKKNKNGKILLSLLKRIGNCTYNIHANTNQVNTAIKHYHTLIGN